MILYTLQVLRGAVQLLPIYGVVYFIQQGGGGQRPLFNLKNGFLCNKILQISQGLKLLFCMEMNENFMLHTCWYIITYNITV